MKKTISVAPMMDCTDRHERYFLSLISQNIHLYSEMIVSNAIIRGDRDKILSLKKLKLQLFTIRWFQSFELAEAVKFQNNMVMMKLI